MTKESENSFVRNLVSGLAFKLKLKMQTLLSEIGVWSFVVLHRYSGDAMFLWVQLDGLSPPWSRVSSLSPTCIFLMPSFWIIVHIVAKTSWIAWMFRICIAFLTWLQFSPDCKHWDKGPGQTCDQEKGTHWRWFVPVVKPCPDLFLKSAVLVFTWCIMAFQAKSENSSAGD